MRHAAVLLPLTLALLAAGCSDKPAATPKAAPETETKGEAKDVTLDAAMQKEAGVTLVTASIRSLPQVVRASGRITIDENRTWRVGAVTEGRMMKVFVNPGDGVEQGQVLARMHSHDIHESRALYRKAVSDLARLHTTEAYTQRARDRARRLYELKAASLEQVEQAETNLRNVQTEKQNAQTEVQRLKQHLEEFLQIPPDETGNPDHDEDLIPIKSPAKGIVLARNVTPGTVVAPSSELFVISDLSSLWMIAAVNEEFLSRLRAGMGVRVFVQAYPERPFQGKIARLGEELDAATRTIRARVELSNEHRLLRPEMYANAEIEVGGTEPALFVPEIAVQEIKGQRVVFVRKAADRFEIRSVETGRAMAGDVQISSGLKPGDMVVGRGSFLLKSQVLKSVLAEE